MTKHRAKVLVLSAYPIRYPQHGGQIRVREIVKAYRAAGLHVRHCSAFPDHAGYLRRGIDPADIAVPAARLRAWRNIEGPYLEDFAVGELVAGQPELLERMELHAAGRLSVLHVEQPGMLPVALALRARARLGEFDICYGSQNVEWRLRQGMWAAAGVDQAQPLSDAVRAAEQHAVAMSSLVAAVTPSDRSELQEWLPAGAHNLVLAGNGISPWRADPIRLQQWRQRLSTAGVSERFLLYAASDHPPNVQGFGVCFGSSLAVLPPGRSLVVAGSAGPAIERSHWYGTHAGVNATRMVALGLLADADLDALRVLAHGFIVPVMSGGGSNLKTAEALYSGRHAVLTPMAVRGFESLLPWAGATIAEPGEAFARAVCNVMRSEPRALDQYDPRREQLTWAQQLQPLVQAVVQLARTRSAGSP